MRHPPLDMNLRYIGLVLACSVAQTTCGQVDDFNNQGDVSGSSGGARVVQGSTGGSISTAGAGGSTNAEHHWGQVLIADFDTNALGPTVMAMFRLGLPAEDCPSRRFGDCVFTPTCVPATNTTYVDAGTLIVTSATPPVNVAMEPVAGGSYVSQSFAADFLGGETLRVSATGATVPAFAAVLAVADSVSIAGPAADANGVIATNSTSTLALTFDSGAVPAILTVQGTSASGSLYCESGGISGELTLASSVLSALGAGTTLRVLTLVKRDLTAGAWQLDVGFLTEARSAATLQPIKVRID